MTGKPGIPPGCVMLKCWTGWAMTERPGANKARRE